MRRPCLAWVVFASLAFGTALIAEVRRSQPATPSGDNEARAVAFLSTEVPRWRREHPCYSCHNNGDATRALIVAGRRGYQVREALADTLTWIRQPAAWDQNSSRGGFDNKPLMRLQFASALSFAVAAGLGTREALVEAADLIAKDQGADGSWRLDASQSLGSPATYGTALATGTARRTLVAANEPRFGDAIAAADRWARAADIETVLDAAAIVWALESGTDPAAAVQRKRSLDIIRRGEAPGGGWGPYVTSRPEPFDTAVVMLALISASNLSPDAKGNVTAADLAQMVERGRTFLRSTQLEDGSWPETTRPAEQESYAQRISTAGWATLALLESARH